MSLAHPERHRWVKQISSINKKINQTTQAPVAKRTMSGGGDVNTSLDIDAIMKRQLEKEEQKLKELVAKGGVPPPAQRG